MIWGMFITIPKLTGEWGPQAKNTAGGFFESRENHNPLESGTAENQNHPGERPQWQWLLIFFSDRHIAGQAPAGKGHAYQKKDNQHGNRFVFIR